MAPHVVQCESHPFLQQWDLIEFCKNNHIQFMAYSPLGYGAFKKADEITVLTDPTLKKIAAKHGKSTAQVRQQNGRQQRP
jgi:diketogulonate reductase-like aldo/keto reductase